MDEWMDNWTQLGLGWIIQFTQNMGVDNFFRVKGLGAACPKVCQHNVLQPPIMLKGMLA